MRRAANIDGNHVAVVKLLRQCGMSVQSLAAVGGGVPDLLVGWRGCNVLLEVKDGNKPPSAQALNAEQRDWHAKWGGQVAVATSPDEAVQAVMAACGVRSHG